MPRTSNLAVGAQLLRSRLEDRLFGAAEPTRLGRYRLIRKVGQGAMGVVYEARDDALQRRVALKLIRPERAGPAMGERFAREANAMARVTHANVAAVFDLGQGEDELFIAMEFVEGPTLTAWLLEQPRTTQEVVAVFQRIALGLEAAHQAGVVHRDFKPDNVLIAAGDMPKVVDFGLANLQQTVPSSPSDPAVSRPSTARRLTETAAIVGTPRYAAPEVFAGGIADERSDQFSFCAALFEALYGHAPVRGDTLAELRESARLGRVDWPRRDPHPRPLREALARGLERVPERRWPSMLALRSALGGENRGRWKTFGAIGGGVAALGVLAFGGGRDEPCRADAELAAAWDDQRGAVRTALAGESKTVAAVEQGIDAFVAKWSAAYNAACASPSEAQGRDVALACLAEHEAQLRHTVELLATPDDRLAPRALRLVRALPRAQRCSDTEDRTLPADPERRLAFARARQQLARAAVLERAGDYEAAERVARDVLERAEARRLDVLVTEAEARLGSVLLSKTMLDAAQTHLERAHALAVAADRTALAGKVAADLSGVFAARGRRGEALRWARFSVAIARRGSDKISLVIALNALHEAHRQADRADEAAAAIDEAMEVAAAAYDAGDGMHGVLRWNRALTDWQRGDFEAAEAGAREALEVLRAGYGEHHPMVGRVLMFLAVLRGEQQRHAEALELSERALEVLERSAGEDGAVLFNALLVRGQSLCAFDRLDEGVVVLERARAIADAAYGPTSARVISSLTRLSGCYTNADRYDEAIAVSRLAVTLVEQSSEPSVDLLGAKKTNLAQNLLRVGDLEEALRLAQEALVAAQETNGNDHPDLVYSRLTLTLILLELGRFDDAATHALEAIGVAERHYPPGGWMVMAAALNAGLVELGRKDATSAEPHLARALAVAEETYGPGAPQTAEKLVALGEARLLQGRAAEAKSLAERAMAVVELSDYQRAMALFVRARATRAPDDAREALAVLNNVGTWSAGAKAERVQMWLDGLIRN